jgi:hypothetical protein
MAAPLRSKPVASGKYSLNVVPYPTSLYTLMCPPDCRMKP